MQQERLDRRAALAAWAQVETNRDREQRPEPFTLAEIVDWLGHGFQQHPPAGGDGDSVPAVPAPSSEADSLTPEELMQRAHQFMQLYGESKTTDIANGTGTAPREGDKHG